MPKAIDAFAGAGGLSLGLCQAGFSVGLAFDHDPIAVATHEDNLDARAMVLDANSVSGGDLLALAGIARGELDLLAGGPPCQGFSLQRRGERSDPRNELVLRYLEWLSDMQPRAFLVENVAAITSVRGRAVISAVQEHAENLGYSCELKVLDAADFGLAQHRRRAFLVGILGGKGAFKWPTPSAEHSCRTVRDAIGDLPSPPLDGSPHPEVANHYREARLSPLNEERISYVPQGGGRLDIPERLQLKCHQGSHRHLDVYGRLAWDAPSGTITARFDSFTRGRFAHPIENRSLTIREGARLQGFPDDFVFRGNREAAARQVGNAVPPPLAYQLGVAIRSALNAVDQDNALESSPTLVGSAESTA